MPTAVNGTGTQWYGRALVEPDGSYVTTEWVTVLWIPIVYVGTVRVRRVIVDKKQPWYNPTIRPADHYTTSHIPAYWPLVLGCYSITASLILFLAAVWYFNS